MTQQATLFLACLVIGMAGGALAWDYWGHRRYLRDFRRGFLAGFNFAVGKAGLPPEVHDWPSAIREVNDDPQDPNCS